MKRIVTQVIFLSLLIPSAFTQISDLSTFEARRQLLIDSMASWANTLTLEEFKEADGYDGGKYGAYPAMALFEKGYIEKARQFAEQQLTGGAAMFREFSTMALYCEYKDLYGPELREKVKENQLHSNFYKPGARGNLGGASENHKLMYASAAYLAGIEWPDEYPKLWYEAGYNYLMDWFDELTSDGFWEEDSPTYLIHHMGPVLSVAEHAPEGSEMKKKATMILEWYFLSVAGEYLHGYWITPAARDYNPLYGVENSAETTALMWLYFGDSRLIPYPHVHSTMYHWKSAVHFAVSDYVLPEIIRQIATDRDKPYVHREYMDRNPMKPKEYCYITPHYGMASIAHEIDNIPRDMTRWKVQWVAQTPDMEPTVFFMKHPVGKPENWHRWRGASPYEQVLQSKNALMAVYNIDDQELPFIDGPFHKEAFKAVKSSGKWIFVHTGNMLMGIYAVNGLEKSPDARQQDNHGKDMLLQAIRSDGRKNGLVVQLADPANYPGTDIREQLRSFMNDVKTNTKIDASGIKDPEPKLIYTSLSGDVLSIEFDGPRKINGEVMAFDHWPMLEDPWMKQEFGEKKLELNHDGHHRIYDFVNWKVITD